MFVWNFGVNPPSLFHPLTAFNLPLPLAAKWPQSMMLPVPCLTICTVFLGLKPLPLLQTCSCSHAFIYTDINMNVRLISGFSCFLGTVSFPGWNDCAPYYLSVYKGNTRKINLMFLNAELKIQCLISDIAMTVSKILKGNSCFLSRTLSYCTKASRVHICSRG